LNLYHDDSGRFGKKWPDKEYVKMIQYGTLGQLGESFYLFLYRDFMRKSAYYGAVIFFNKPDEFGNPVRVTCIEQDGSERKRDIYIKVALHFFKNEYKNTMDLAGSVEKVFALAKVKIDSYVERKIPQRKVLADFNFDLSKRKIKFEKIELPKIDKNFQNHLLKENLSRLEENPVNKKETETRAKAVPGLNLRVELQDFTRSKTFLFQPLIIPLKRNGIYGKPRKFESVNSDHYEFEFKKIPPNLSDFFELFFYDSGKDAAQSTKLRIINQLYFKRIAGQIFDIPDALVYCQPDNSFNDKGYKPLKRIIFKKIELRFAPSLKKGSEFTIFLRFTTHKNKVLNARDNYEIKIIDDQVYIFFLSSEGFYYFAVAEEAEHFLPLFNFLASQREFYLYDFEEVSSTLKNIESRFITCGAELLKKYKFTLLPTPVLRICKENKKQESSDLPHKQNNNSEGERLEIEFDYAGEIRKFIAKNHDKEVYTYEKNEGFEASCVELLKSDNLLKQEIGRSDTTQSVYTFFSFRECNYIEWLIEKGKDYLEKGFKIFSSEWESYVGYTGSEIKIDINNGIDWLEFRPTITSPESGRDYKIVSIDVEKNFVIDEKGTLHLVTKQEIDKLKNFLRYGEYSGGVFRVPSGNHILIRELYDKRMEDIPAVKKVLESNKKLENFKTIKEYELSKTFRGQLRVYQKEGFNWLNFLRGYDFSGCLADDMGLGKTVQTLALLLSLKEKKKLDTSLLVVPVSAIPNWEIEMERFTPTLTYFRHLGIKRDKETSGWGEWDLVITSYATMRNDINLLKDFNFDYIILDESQNIKNHSSLISKATKILIGNNRLALSGTPIENKSTELWSLFDFLMPGFLGDLHWFKNQFTTPIERDKDRKKIELLKKMIYPFILRRKKENVEQDLPEKIEIVSKLKMADEQLKLYTDTANHYKEELAEQIDENNVSKSTIRIFEAMLRLRQICLFPHLVDAKHQHISSAKFDYLVELLEDILSENHKVLIFSQFVQVLKIIKKHLDKNAINYSYLDGSIDVAKREKAIKAFQQEDEVGVFLLSLKAGGVALNLTAADYVIIFDPWWNPAVEAQAIDRSHRIGQTKKVFVYRMVLADSIEEKMLKLQEQKKALVDNLITSDSKAFKDLSKEDILDLFNPIS
jgi:SNF2 family DNA or RNA helicase